MALSLTSVYPSDLGPPKATALGQPHRVQPELRQIRFSFDVHVSRLVSVPGVEEQPIGSAPKTVGMDYDSKPTSAAACRLVSASCYGSSLGCPAQDILGHRAAAPFDVDNVTRYHGSR
jgi:hypothetical protein